MFALVNVPVRVSATHSPRPERGARWRFPPREYERSLVAVAPDRDRPMSENESSTVVVVELVAWDVNAANRSVAACAVDDELDDVVGEFVGDWFACE